jgi:hypothetical protein
MKPIHVRCIVALLALAGAGAALAITSAGDAQRAPEWIDAPELPAPELRCGESPEHAAHRALIAEKAARERVAVYALAPNAGLIARARFAEAQACAELAGDAQQAQRIGSAASAFSARLAHDYAKHVERYRLSRRAGRTAAAGADIAFVDALWNASDEAAHASFFEQLRADRALAEEEQP